MSENFFSEKNNIINENSKKEFPIWINLIICAFPVALYLLFQHLGSAIDYYIIKQSPNKTNNVDAAVTYMKQIKKVLQSIAISLGGAGVVLVSREYKKDNKTKAQQYAVLIFFIALISSLVICLFFCLGAFLPYVGNFFLNKEYRQDGGLEYYNISLITFVLITINAVFIGLERSKNKNLFVLFLNILNIVFRIFLSFFYKKIYNTEVTVIHLAWADFYSNLIISILAFYFMFNSKNEFQLLFHKLTFPKNIIKNILKLSSILVIGKTTYDIGKKFINDMATAYHGKDLLAITGFVMIVNGICYSVSQSFEDAQSVLVSQKAKIDKNTKTLKIFKNVFVITLIIGIIGILINQYYGQNLLNWLKPDKQFSKEELNNFKEVLFFEQMSLFTSIWASMMMFYVMSYKKNANIILFLNILRIITRMFLLWFFCKCISLWISSPYKQFGLSTSISNIIVLIITTILFIQFIQQQKKIEFKK